MGDSGDGVFQRSVLGTRDGNHGHVPLSAHVSSVRSYVCFDMTDVHSDLLTDVPHFDNNVRPWSVFLSTASTNSKLVETSNRCVATSSNIRRLIHVHIHDGIVER